MNSLQNKNVVFVKKDDAFTNTLEISKGSGIDHEEIKTLIDQYKDRIDKYGKNIDNNQKSYDLNENQATFVITLLSNTDKVVDFKEQMSNQFVEAKNVIQEKKTKQWEMQRFQLNENRKIALDSVKCYVDYCKASGSKNADKYYATLTTLVNKHAKVNGRDFAGSQKLKNLQTLENVINICLKNCVEMQMEYHAIYKFTKTKVEEMAKYLN